MNMNKNDLRMFIFFSEMLDRRILDEAGNNLGKLNDLIIQMGEPFPKVILLCVVTPRPKTMKVIAWDEVLSLEGNVIRLKGDASVKFQNYRGKSQELLLRDEILDKQVVDTYGSKLERVNDLHFLINQGELRLVHVDVGVRAILQRLGFIKAVDALSNWFFAYQIPSKLIAWKYVQPLAKDPFKEALKVNVTQRRLSAIHPSELADILEELDREKREAMFKTLDVETAAETLEEVHPEVGASLIETVAEEKASDIIEVMAPDDAVDLLADLPEEKKETIIQVMEKGKRETLENLLAYPEGTAGSLMSVEYITLLKNLSVTQAIEQIRKQALASEVVYYVYATNEQKQLLGVLSLRHLLLAPPDSTLDKIMNKRVKKLKTNDSKRKVVNIFRKYDYVVVPVVDENNIIKGIITLKDAIEAEMPEFRHPKKRKIA
jgi:CBS domain-containing protein/sporulation protein YlmC with PRC-barrel domain